MVPALDAIKGNNPIIAGVDYYRMCKGIVTTILVLECGCK